MKFLDWNGDEHNLPKGKSVTWRPAAYGIVFNKAKDKILLVKAKSHGKWELPGGGIAPKEKIFFGLKREVFEETGYKIKLVNDSPIFVKETFFYAKDLDEYFHCLLNFYLAKILNDNQILEHIDFKNEILEIKWFKFNELGELEIKDHSSDAIREYLEKIDIDSNNSSK